MKSRDEMSPHIPDAIPTGSQSSGHLANHPISQANSPALPYNHSQKDELRMQDSYIRPEWPPSLFPMLSMLLLLSFALPVEQLLLRHDASRFLLTLFSVFWQLFFLIFSCSF